MKGPAVKAAALVMALGFIWGAATPAVAAPILLSKPRPRFPIGWTEGKTLKTAIGTLLFADRALASDCE